MERIALQDAERERERVLKEAEEKLKELELNKQFNETTQVKRPIEDVINSDIPIQLTRAKTPTSTIGETTPVTSNYDPTKYEATSAAASSYPFYYATSNNPTVSFNYSSSVASSVAEPSVAFSKQAQNVSNRSVIQSVNTSNLVAQPNATSQSPNTSQHACLPRPNLQQTSLSQTNTVPTNLPNYYSAAPNNLTRNQTINLPPNQPQTSAPQGQLTKNHSDNSLSQSGLQSTSLYGGANPATAQQHYSQSHQLQTSLPNYNAYLNSPTNQANYPQPTTSTTASIRGIYNNAAVSFHAYPPPPPPQNQMPHLNHNNLPSGSPNNSLNNKPNSNNNLGQQSYPLTTYSTTNYVPSAYTNGILLPQQSTPPVASNGAHQSAKDKKQIAANKQTSDIVTSSTENDSGNSLSSNVQAANLPFARPNGKKIDVTDFENSSSPFDDALLRSIDDKEELNNIFQQFYNGAK